MTGLLPDAGDFSADAMVRVAIDLARAAWPRDKTIIAKQAAYHLLAWQCCECVEHSCGGCARSLDIANRLELEAAKVPLEAAEEGRAAAANAWQADGRQLRDRRMLITLRTANHNDERSANAKADKPGRYGSDS